MLKYKNGLDIVAKNNDGLIPVDLAEDRTIRTHLHSFMAEKILALRELSLRSDAGDYTWSD